MGGAGELTLPTRRTVLAAAAVAAIPLSACSGPISVGGTGAGARIARAAQNQLGETNGYDPSYQKLGYPGGDVPRRTGACVDVLIRAVRDGIGQDLQQIVHEDMTKDFGAYPALWGLDAPDPNIDHRRVPVVETALTRRGGRIWQAGKGERRARSAKDLETGDVLTWRSFRGASHLAVVTRGRDRPLILHNDGHGVVQHALWLTEFGRSAFGHYRWVAL